MTAQSALPPTPDERMAEILAGAGPSLQGLRADLRDEQSPESEDLLGRLNALEFVDSLVGHATDLPSRLGDYEIKGLLGRGGMGTVYAAYQPQLDRDVALKVLSPAYSADPTMRKRFQKEAKATAALHHQHIVPIYDYGEAGGLLFFAMEKVDGVSLDRHIAAARRAGHAVMEPRVAAARFAGVADALGHAHKRKILHRDVKPGNLLVHGDGTLALADFGLSKSIGEQSRLSQTTGGGFLGTLLYAAPEQALGKELTPSSDLYSLGVAMFETVTGELPLHGKTTEAMLEALLHGRPKRLREVLPKAPKDLDAVLDKLLSKEPTDRYADGEELARDLQRVADGDPVRISRQWALVRAWRRVRKAPGAAAAIAFSVLLLAVSSWLWLSKEAERQRSDVRWHQIKVQQAVDEALRHTGDAAGPPGLLEALVGTNVPRETAPSSVQATFAEAEALLPGQTRVRDLEWACDDSRPDDHLRQAAELLRAGEGREARAILDRAIAGTQSGRSSDSAYTTLWLYRYHVARAVACLSASVAQLDEAKADLITAGAFRHRAFFPKLLQLVLRRLPEGSTALLARLDELLVDAPPGAGPAAGWLLVAVAGLQRSATSQLVEFPLSYADRRRLHLAGLDLLGAGATPPVAAANGFCGLEEQLCTIARNARDAAGDRQLLREAVGAGEELLRDKIEGTSPLQCWGFVLHLLQEPRAEPRLPSGEPMPAALQVAAFTRLLRLGPPPGFLTILRDRITKLLDAEPKSLPTAELRCLLALATGTVAEIKAAALEWFEQDPDSPEPQLARFTACVRAGDLANAEADAGLVCQLAVDRQLARQALLAILDRDGSAAAVDWSRLRADLQRA